MSDKTRENPSVEGGRLGPKEFVQVLSMVWDLAKTFPKELEDLVSKSLENRSPR